MLSQISLKEWEKCCKKAVIKQNVREKQCNQNHKTTADVSASPWEGEGEMREKTLLKREKRGKDKAAVVEVNFSST